MINSQLRFITRSRSLLALTCAASLALASVPALTAADTGAAQPSADKAPALPLSGTFEKGTNTEEAPLVLKLKNNSANTLKVSAKVLLSVVHHAMDKARHVPEQAIAPGAVATITDISPNDRIIVSAAGYESVEFIAPFKL